MVYSYRDFLPELELFALMVACLCHDVDHRGRNNSYQVQYSASPILRLSLFISIAFYYNLPTSSIFIFYLVIYILLQVAAQTSLADLYGTSATMEQHHFSYTVHILNTEGHNIFSNLSPKNYKKILKSIEVITQSICIYIYLYLYLTRQLSLKFHRLVFLQLIWLQFQKQEKNSKSWQKRVHSIRTIKVTYY